MVFIQATRFIFFLLKYFAIDPFTISGPPNHRLVKIDKKAFIFGNFILLLICTFLLYIFCFNFKIETLSELVSAFSIIIVAITLISSMVISFVYKQDIRQTYEKLIFFFDLHSRHCAKYYSTIILCSVFMFFNFLGSFLTSIVWRWLADQNSTVIQHDVFSYFTLFFISFYLFLIICQLNLFLLFLLICFKIMNDNLTKFIIKIRLYGHYYLLFEKVNNIFEILILELASTQFLWLVYSVFVVIVNAINKNSNLFLDLFIILNHLFYVIGQLIITCVLGEKLKHEVRWYWCFFIHFMILNQIVILDLSAVTKLLTHLALSKILNACPLSKPYILKISFVHPWWDNFKKLPTLKMFTNLKAQWNLMSTQIILLFKWVFLKEMKNIYFVKIKNKVHMIPCQHFMSVPSKHYYF